MQPQEAAGYGPPVRVLLTGGGAELFVRGLAAATRQRVPVIEESRPAMGCGHELERRVQAARGGAWRRHAVASGAEVTTGRKRRTGISRC